MTQLISTIAIAMGASWVSGINLYAAVATLGLARPVCASATSRRTQVLTSWWVIGVAVVLYVIEFVADKIPYVDSTWDVIHTFIRVPAGAVLAASAFGDFDRSIQVIALLRVRFLRLSLLVGVPLRYHAARRARDDGDRRAVAAKDVLHGRRQRRTVSHDRRRRDLDADHRRQGSARLDRIVAVADSDPNIIYLGTGSDGVRSNVSTGRGVYKSTDGGETWKFIGLYNAGQIGAVRIHPTNPDIVWVAATATLQGKRRARRVQDY
jgi:hypothetical protein